MPIEKTIHNPEYRQLLDILISERKRVRKTTRQVGKILGVPHTWVVKIETGERRLDVLEFVRLVRAIDGDPMKFLKQFDRIVREAATDRR